MFKKVFFVYVVCAAGAAHAEEQLLLGMGCYTQTAMKDIVQLSEAEGMVLGLQHLQDGKCAPTITTQSDWDAGAQIRDTGVRAVYARVCNWAGDGSCPSPTPPKQVMYFDASSADETDDTSE